MKTIVKNLAVILLTCLVVFVGTEIYYRWINPEILGNTGSLSYMRWAKANFKVNSWGFRDKERTINKSNPDIHRILVLGPSNIVGQGVTNIEERLSERLEKKLNERNPKYEVINCGDMTLDPVGSMARILSSMINNKVEFDTVVFYYSWNAIKHIPDIQARYYQIKKSNETKKQNNPLAQYLSKHSYAYDWLSNVSQDKKLLIEGKTYNEWHLGFYQQESYFMEHIKVLNSIDKALKQNNKKMILLLTPVSYNPDERAKYLTVVEIFKKAMDVNSISYVDATKIYDGIAEKDIPVSKYDGHNKPKYYQNMVELLAPEILNYSK
ncbi:MAG: hypothetical protein RLZZ361_396 [Cyanobacteriota bacterium]|jgi:hypothetical protein